MKPLDPARPVSTNENSYSDFVLKRGNIFFVNYICLENRLMPNNVYNFFNPAGNGFEGFAALVLKYLI